MTRPLDNLSQMTVENLQVQTYREDLEKLFKFILSGSEKLKLNQLSG